MSLLTFDTHEFVKKLTSVGFTEEQAEVFANEQKRIIGVNLVTKEYFDVQIEKTNDRLDSIEVQIEKLVTKEQFAFEMRELKHQMTIKMGSMMAALAVIIIASIKYL